LAYLRRASSLDIAPDATERFFPRVPVTAIHRRFADEFLGRAGINAGHKLVGINLGAAHGIKRWSPARFAQVVDTLLREDAATRVVVFGAPAMRLCSSSLKPNWRPLKQLKVSCRVLVWAVTRSRMVLP
jgi:ADP-heptose:LPS heptosyltransferase